MKRVFILAIASLSLGLLTGCSGSSGGIGAPPNTGQDGPQPPTGEPCAEVTLTWTAPTHNTDGSPLTNLAGYRLYMGLQSGVYSDQVELNDPLLDTTIVNDLEFGRSYYFVMTAYNSLGIESDYSGEAVKLTDSCPAVLDFSRVNAHH